MSEQITRAWKGLDEHFCCCGRQFAIGETYEVVGDPVIGVRGFHACSEPLDVLTHYAPSGSRFAEVELIGQTVRKNGGSTLAASRIRVLRELSYQELGFAHAAYLAGLSEESGTTDDRGHVITSEHYSDAALTRDGASAATTGYGATAATTGYRGHAVTAAERACATTAGWKAHALTDQQRSHAATTGEGSHAATGGLGAHATTTGDDAHAVTAFFASHAATTGEKAGAMTFNGFARAATTGHYSDAATHGFAAHATTTGLGAHATATGERAHAITTGDEAYAATNSDYAVSVALGCYSRAKAAAGGWIVLAAYDHDGILIQVKAARCGDADGELKPDTWYWLDETGEFVICKDAE